MKIITNRKDKNVTIDMRDQLQAAFDMFGEELDETVVSPARKDIFSTYDGLCEELDDAKSELFHSVTAKLLFIMKRGRRDSCIIFDDSCI